MRRWQARVATSQTVDDDHVDNAHAFFIFCFHLKDWLKADATLDRAVGRAAEDLVNNNPWLMICADIANGSKHLEVTRTPRYGPGGVFLSTGFPTPEISTDPRDYVDFLPMVRSADGTLVTPAPRLMQYCVEAWDKFLRGQKLLP